MTNTTRNIAIGLIGAATAVCLYVFSVPEFLTAPTDVQAEFNLEAYYDNQPDPSAN